MSQPSPTPPPPRPSASRLLWRAVRLRCPGCGGRPILLRWTRMCDNCPVCGLRLERGEHGYWLGAYFFNLVAMETVFVLGFVGLLVATWPTPPWALLQVLAVALMVLAPVAFFPFSKTLFLALDLWCRPPGAEDYAEPHEPARASRRT